MAGLGGDIHRHSAHLPAAAPRPLLPLRAPELNPQENIWQFMRANWLSNRIFKSFDEIVDSLLLRLEYAHRSTVENHVHRPPRLGSRRSLIVRVGISGSGPKATGLGAASSE